MKRISILLVLLALVATACAGEEAASASPSEASATAQPTPEPEESEAAAASEPAASGLAVPSFGLDGDPELAARFPDTVGGQPFTMISARGDQMGGGGATNPTFQAFLDSIDADMTDVSVAFGFQFDADDPEGGFSAAAFRVLGATEDELATAFIAATEESAGFTGFESASVGGKDVRTATDPSGESSATVYLYAKDDTMYFLTGSEEQAAEVLEALP